MTTDRISLHRVEECNYMDKSLIVSFQTERFGIYQYRCVYRDYRSVYRDDDGLVFEELDREPDMHMFPVAHRNYMKHTIAIAWRIIFDGATPEAFK